MVDVAIDRSLSEQVRDIIFDAFKSIRKKSKRPDAISTITEHITRNPTNFKKVVLRDSISKLVDGAVLINKKTKQDRGSIFINEGTSTDNTLQEQNDFLLDTTPIDTETLNCALAEASTKSDSDRVNDLKGEINNNTASFSAFKIFVLDELHKIKDKVYRIQMEAVLLKI